MTARPNATTTRIAATNVFEADLPLNDALASIVFLLLDL
jgi:hypothetical protein